MSFQSSLGVLSDEAPTWEVIELLRALSPFILHTFGLGIIFWLLLLSSFIRFYTEIGKLVNEGFVKIFTIK